MRNYNYSSFKRCAVFILIFSSFLLLDENIIYAVKLLDDAEDYRNKGYLAQEKGDIDSAISWYQKASSLNVDYSAPHNDLGVLFERKGWLDRAESEYKKALLIDPNYASSHANIALFYERKGEIEKSSFHWMKRYKLGDPNDPWTQKAKERVQRLGLLPQDAKQESTLISSPVPPSYREQDKSAGKGNFEKEALDKEWLGEENYNRKKQKSNPKPTAKFKPEPKPKSTPIKVEEIKKEWKSPDSTNTSQWTKVGVNKEIDNGKADSKMFEREVQDALVQAENIVEKEKEILVPKGANVYYLESEQYYKKGEYSSALDVTRKAKEKYPQDSKLLELEQSIKNKMKEGKIEEHCSEGLKFYNNKDYSSAKKEFEAILNILPE